MLALKISNAKIKYLGFRPPPPFKFYNDYNVGGACKKNHPARKCAGREIQALKVANYLAAFLPFFGSGLACSAGFSGGITSKSSISNLRTELPGIARLPRGP